MARIDAAAIRVERQWVTAADVVDAAIAHVRHALEGHALRVDADADHGSGNRSAPGVGRVVAHARERRAVFPPDREIPVDARVEPDGLHVSVTDQGPGLDPGELEHLFERFYRGRTARQASPGTGWGSRSPAASCGGRRPGLGGERARRRREILIVVPGRSAATVTSVTWRRASSSSTTSRTSSPPWHRCCGRAATSLLGDERASGLEAVERDKPDLVVLDLGLPDIDGVEVCRGSREPERADPRAVGTRRRKATRCERSTPGRTTT